MLVAPGRRHPPPDRRGFATVTGIVHDSYGGAVPGVPRVPTRPPTSPTPASRTHRRLRAITSVPIGEYIRRRRPAGLQGRPVQRDAVGRADGARRLQDGSRQRRGAAAEVVAPAPCCKPRRGSMRFKVNRSNRAPAGAGRTCRRRRSTPPASPPRPEPVRQHARRRPAAVDGSASGQQLHRRRRRLEQGHQRRHHLTSRARRRRAISVETNNYSAELGNVAGPSSTW